MQIRRNVLEYLYSEQFVLMADIVCFSAGKIGLIKLNTSMLDEVACFRRMWEKGG